MKKKRTVLLGVLLIALPFLAFAMDTAMKDVRWLTDSEMEALEGQAGVTIDFYQGDASVVQSMDAISWGDADGLTSGTLNVDDGHIRVYSAARADGDPFSVSISISEGEEMRLDVDELLGLCITLPRVEQTLGLPVAGGIVIAHGAGEMPGAAAADWYDDVTEEFGTLSWRNLATAIDAPGIIAIRPH